ncbi:YbgA family protein [Salirhabdus salicampi]|uniref:YbgA family protein n=1 Tax=Salirhabdus salicampi TaxID=476102 RepID=UPI0020C204DA|nr:DUF523 and DUF1722 domain-containing protein [Salirhabdus salicampi]MCP8616273.1 DUF523 and DUF1722 domain-containing protein [Salirhabdus salicampi]
MGDFTKPVVVVSKCLEFGACRYNGDMLSDSTISKLKDHVTFRPVCPEVEIGLGVPRETIRLVKEDFYKPRLMQPSTREDLTEKMNKFSMEYVSSLKNDIDGFILKGRSPTCGIRDAKVYAKFEKSPVVEKTSGLFASHILNAYPSIVVEEEGRLKNFIIREHFFTKLFTLSEFRRIRTANSVERLKHFHHKHHYLFIAYNQTQYKKLKQLIARQTEQTEQLFHQYEQGLLQLFQKAPRYTSNVKVCKMIFHKFKHLLIDKEQHFFADHLTQYSEKRIPLSTITSLLKSWLIRFGETKLLEQSYFNPYPNQLIEISDSGKGRDYN